ncbi:MAG: thiamine biosynthesis protein ThiJ [Robiginitomaculum sp.]|nr:MAG: thiamine biosynthesis protein ThiJ [Robiginitomaculum sp.]
MIRIGIFIFDGVEELDFVGPYEVFTMINEVFNYFGKPDAVNVQLLSEHGGQITGAKKMRVLSDAAIADSSDWDVILIPGGEGTRALLKNEVFLTWLRSQAKTAKWVTSVCTGSMLLAQAGLTEGKKITTHHMNFEEFKKRGLPGKLIADVRYVSDGNLITAAGVSAGIDMALWLTGQMFTPVIARSVQSAMQYDPDPPYGEKDIEQGEEK